MCSKSEDPITICKIDTIYKQQFNRVGIQKLMLLRILYIICSQTPRFNLTVADFRQGLTKNAEVLCTLKQKEAV